MLSLGDTGKGNTGEEMQVNRRQVKARANKASKGELIAGVHGGSEKLPGESDTGEIKVNLRQVSV